MGISVAIIQKDRVVSFCWQHFLLLVSLFIMTLGVALCIRSDLGSSVISSLPLAFSLAGENSESIPELSLGMYTNILNLFLVGTQILILRKNFPPVQLLQLVVSLIFGVLIDINMAITSGINSNDFISKAFVQIMGCTIMGFGIAMEVRCGSVTMAGEGVPVAMSRTFGIPFPKAKICVDITLVVLASAASILFFGSWQWNIVGIGTLFAMIYIGLIVKLFGKHMKWFERLLGYKIGFRRYIYGLAKYLHRNN